VFLASQPGFDVLQTTAARAEFLQASGDGAIADICVQFPQSAFLITF
jgi:hypothetical protein